MALGNDPLLTQPIITENSEQVDDENQVDVEDIDNLDPVVWPEMTDLEKEIMREWASDTNSMNLHNLINILHEKLNHVQGFSFYEKLKNMDFTKPDGELVNNIMAKILTVSYCRYLDHKNGVETQTTSKLIELWNDFQSHYFQIES
jgi:hypothetical protein